MWEGIDKGDVEWLKTPNYAAIQKTAIDFSDAVIKGSPKINSDIEKYIKKSGKPTLEYQKPEEYIDAYSEFYDEVLELEPEYAD